MRDCIFTGHCSELYCDKSCPIYAQVSYLMNLNHLDVTNSATRKTGKPIAVCSHILDSYAGKLIVIENDNIKAAADLFTYCAICKNWPGSCLNATVYSMNVSKYLEDIKRSWSVKCESDALQYSRIWSEASKILILSNMDYISFKKDFEAQTILSLIQDRESQSKTTVIVVKKVSELIGSGPFYDKMRKILEKARVCYDNIH